MKQNEHDPAMQKLHADLRKQISAEAAAGRRLPDSTDEALDFLEAGIAAREKELRELRAEGRDIMYALRSSKDIKIVRILARIACFVIGLTIGRSIIQLF